MSKKKKVKGVKKELDNLIEKTKKDLKDIKNKVQFLEKEKDELIKKKIEFQNRYKDGKVIIELPEKWNKFYSVLNCPKCGKLALVSYWHESQRIIGIGSDGDFQCRACLEWFHEGDDCIIESHLKDNKMVFEDIYNNTSEGVVIETD